ncbi:MAG: type II toxin-antitoxin system Phd/YefM family antitoxin [Mycobacteriales bacterium]
MVEVIAQRELRNDNARVIRRVAGGESFTITCNGHPVADLVPHQLRAKRRFIPVAELGALLEQTPDWGIDSWYLERDELDRHLVEDRSDPWGSVTAADQ